MVGRTWAEIDLGAVEHNVRAVNKMLGGKSKLMAIVKADAYGHGAVDTARVAADCGVGFFGVACIDEAVQLREGGLAQDMLVLGYTHPSEENVRKIIEHNIAQAVYDLEQTRLLARMAGRDKIKAHIKINTGMNRLGLGWTGLNRDMATVDAIKAMAGLQNIECEGIFTHFAVSEDLSSDFTREQFGLFCELVSLLEREGVYFKLKHAANSGAAINFADMHLDYVRCGLILYGLYPAPGMRDIGIMPAMELKTRMAQVHIIRRGETVSYGRTYRAEQDITAATLPVGYADGFSRLLSNRGGALINGVRAPVIGRVCMDQCVVDASDCGEIKIGDEVTLFGRGGISVEQVADLMGTINYEAVCLIGKRVPRIYL